MTAFPEEAALFPSCPHLISLERVCVLTLTCPAVLVSVFLCFCVNVNMNVSEGQPCRERTCSFSAVSHSCCLFYPLLFAADVRTTFSLITSKGISCIWTIRWGHAWMFISQEPVIINTLVLCSSSNVSLIHFDSWKSSVWADNVKHASHSHVFKSQNSSNLDGLLHLFIHSVIYSCVSASTLCTSWTSVCLFLPILLPKHWHLLLFITKSNKKV